MRNFFLVLFMLLPFSLMAAPVQPSDLQDDDFGNMNVGVMACLAGFCDDNPQIAFITTPTNSPLTQSEIDAADKIPLFDPFADAGFIIDDVQVQRTPGGFSLGTDVSSVFTPDQWVQFVVLEGTQWLADIALQAIGENSFFLDFPDAAQTRLLVVDATTEISSVPIPSAVWLFGTGLLGLVGIARR